MPARHLHLLSSLAQLHTPRAEPQALLHWQAQSLSPVMALTRRQWRRWQLLAAYWAQAGDTLLAHTLRRKSLNETQAAHLRRLARAARPPEAPELLPDSAAPWSALFVYNRDGVTLGDCRPLQLRQLDCVERFPPLHLSAQHDASMLAAGNLALEALSQFLGRKLALDSPFPLWLEAAFADDARLSDSSASLLLAAAALQKLFELRPAAQAFSGRVQRDSGLIQTVQGFELPYGKLEAAFDAGISQLFVPEGTTLNALPQAGVHLKYLAPGHYQYYLADAPDDQMQISYLGQLEDLFAQAIVPQLSAEALQLRLQHLPGLLAQNQSGLPGLARWLDCEARWLPVLPAALHTHWTQLSRQFRLAYEHSQADADTTVQTQAWQTVQQTWQAIVRDWLHWLVMDRGSALILQAESQQAQTWMLKLQQLKHPLSLADLMALAASEQLQAWLQTQSPTLLEPLARLLAFAARLSQTTQHPEAIWQDVRYGLHSLAPEALLQVLAEAGDGPLLQAAKTGCWLYDGADAQATPVYRQLPSGLCAPRPGACPYLPTHLLQLERHFEPCHRREATATGWQQPVACGQSLEMVLRLQNSSEWHLPELSLQDALPAGLRLLTGELHWQGALLPRQSVTLRCQVLPETPGDKVFLPPAVHYTLPDPVRHLAETIQADAMHYESPRLAVLNDQQAELVLQVQAAPVAFKTREPVRFQVQIENRRAVAASDLCWLQRPVWPASLQLLGPLPALPAELPPYGRLTLSWQLVARWPGSINWPGLALRYRPRPGAAWSTLQAAGTQAVVQLNRELPLTGRQADLDWLNTAWQDPSVKGVYLWGQRGVGKHRLLQAWQAEAPRTWISIQALQTQGQSLLQALAAALLPAPWPENQALSWPALIQPLNQQISQSPPGLVLLEQADQLDPESIEGLALLWSLLPAGLFFVLSGESPVLPPAWPLLSRELRPLDLTAIERLLEQLFPEHDFEAELARALLNQTQGLPLRLREYLGFLVQAQVLFCTATGWQQQAGPLPASPSLTALARQDLAPLQDALPTAWLAAVLGQTFSQTELTALQPAVAVSQVLQAGLRAQIWQASGPGHYAFVHALHREALRWAEQAQVPALAAQAWLALAEVAEQPDRLAALQQARDLAEQLKDETLQAEILTQLGVYTAQTETFDAARAYFYQALGHCAPESLAYARVLEQLAYEAIKAGHSQQAEQDLLQAKVIFEVQGDQRGLASTYNRLGAACFYQQALRRARYYFEESEAYYHQLGLRLRHLHVRHNLGLLAEARLQVRQGDFAAAFATASDSLARLEDANDKLLMARLFLAMGEVYQLKGAYVTSQTYAQMAQTQTQGQQPQIQAAVRYQLGQLYAHWGDADQAQSHYQAVLTLLEAPDAGSPPPDIYAAALRGLAALLADQGQASAARKTLATHAALPAPADTFQQIQASLQLAQVAFALKDAATARREAARALTLSKKLKLPLQQAQAGFRLGEIERQAAHFEAAETAYQAAIEQLAGFEHPQLLGPLYQRLGLSQLASDQPQKAVTSLEQALVSHTYHDDVDDQILAEAFEQFAPTFQALVQAYVRSGQTERALQRYEDGRALQLLQQLEGYQRNLFTAMPRANSRQLQALIPADTLVLAYAETPTGQLLRFELTGESLSVTALDAAATATRHPAWEQLKQTLPAADSTRWISRYRQLLANPASDPQDLQALGHLLATFLLPAERPAAQIQRLLILPDGPLALLPFEALRPAWSGGYLVETLDLQYVQSLSVMAQLSQRHHPTDRLPLLALGGPHYEPVSYSREPVESRQQLQQLKQIVRGQPDSHMREIYGALYQPQWAPLPGTRTEIEGIQQQLPTAVLQTGNAVDEARLKQLSATGELQRYRVLHFATHGLTVAEMPALSALVLSQQSAPQSEDGYLRVPEVARLQLAADFVNLSACETGLGKVFRGEGVVGLSQAFLTAGAQQVAVSLWQINDQSTARLMQAMYSQAAEHASHARSLNAVKRQFIQGKFSAEYQHPYYWSPFVVYGAL